jgi:MinD-like ATPase involved in chromosome partitioning or flagellar assembly
MTLQVVGSFSGAPGATTVALALAASWPDAVVVEGDWQGGRLAARFGLRRDPGLVTFAAARAALDLDAHVQVSPAGVALMVGPESGETAEALWGSAGPVVASRLSSTLRSVVVDAGRLSGQSPLVAHVVPLASSVVVVVRNEPGDLAVAAAGLGRLRRANRSVGLVVVGSAPYSAAEIGDALAAPVLSVIPWDPPAAAAVSTGAPHRNLRATGFARAVRSLAEELLGGPDPSANGAAGAVAAVAVRS